MKKTLLAAAILAASVGAQAEGNPQMALPYAAPFAYAPVVTVNEDLAKAYIAFQQKAYERFVAQQKLARENIPAHLRILAIPAVPAFGAKPFQHLARINRNAMEEAVKRAEAFQRSFNQPVDIEKALSERRNELDSVLADAEKRADEVATSL
jgi:hypothetical protein